MHAVLCPARAGAPPIDASLRISHPPYDCEPHGPRGCVAGVDVHVRVRVWVCTRWASLSRARACDAGIARSLILKLFRRGLPLLAVGCLFSGYFFRYAVPGRFRVLGNPTFPNSFPTFIAYSLSL